MSCKHGNHERACDLCDAEEAQYEAGRKAGLAEAAATPSPVPADTAELPPLPNDMERLARRLQSFADRMCNDKSLGEKYEGDESELREAIAILRHLASRPAPVAAVPELTDDMVIRGGEYLHDAGVRFDDAQGGATDAQQNLAEGLFKAMLAATPQPDQSAQEGGKDSGCRMTGGICACRSGGSFGGCAKERAYCCTNEPAAAPSAAQAAGVDWERVAKAQDAKLRAMCNESGGMDRLREVLREAKALEFATTPSEGVAAPVEPAEAEAGWAALTDETQFKEMRTFDIVLKNGVTLYNQHYNVIDWTAVRDWRYAQAAPAQPSADQVRDAALAECEGICADIYRKHRDQYKGRGGYAPDNPRRADPHCDGCADGAAECEEAISKLRTTASGEKGDSNA